MTRRKRRDGNDRHLCYKDTSAAHVPDYFYWEKLKKQKNILKFCVIIDYFLGLLGPFLYFLIFGEKVFLWENPIITHESQMNRLRSRRSYFGSV